MTKHTPKQRTKGWMTLVAALLAVAGLGLLSAPFDVSHTDLGYILLFAAFCAAAYAAAFKGR